MVLELLALFGIVVGVVLIFALIVGVVDFTYGDTFLSGFFRGIESMLLLIVIVIVCAVPILFLHGLVN